MWRVEVVLLWMLNICLSNAFLFANNQQIRGCRNPAFQRLLARNDEVDQLMIVTGASGSLGKAVRKKLQSEAALFLSYRPSMSSLAVEVDSLPMSWFPIEMRNEEEDWLWKQATASSLYSDDDALITSIPNLLSIPNLAATMSRMGVVRKIVLINNAAMCLHGRSLHSFHSSLALNSFLPVLLIAQLRHQLMHLPAPLCSSIEDIVIVNVSSGDGERLFLDSDIAEHIFPISQDSKTGCTDILSWQFYITNHLWSLLEKERNSKEFAVGSAPSYSLSKALLNRATQLLSKQMSSLQLLNQLVPVRFCSVCPGNFASRMSTADELAANYHIIRSPEDAALDIKEIIDNTNRHFVSGGFYRYGQAISM